MKATLLVVQIFVATSSSLASSVVVEKRLVTKFFNYFKCQLPFLDLSLREGGKIKASLYSLTLFLNYFFTLGN